MEEGEGGGLLLGASCGGDSRTLPFSCLAGQLLQGSGSRGEYRRARVSDRPVDLPPCYLRQGPIFPELGGGRMGRGPDHSLDLLGGFPLAALLGYLAVGTGFPAMVGEATCQRRERFQCGYAFIAWFLRESGSRRDYYIRLHTNSLSISLSIRGSS